MNGSERHRHLADAPHFLYRLVEHRRKPWGRLIAAWQFDEFTDALSAYAAERDAIASESPRYNAMHNGAGLTGWNDERRASDFCLNGHPWSGNSDVSSQGIRICRECKRVAIWRYDAKRGRPYAIRKLAETADHSPAEQAS